PEGQGPYGPYAQALAEMMGGGGLPLAQVFERVRLRVNDITKGAEVTWQASHVEPPFLFFERSADAPPPPVPPEQTAAIRAQPIRELGAQQAYALALERDTFEGYGEFVDAYPDDPMAERVRVIIAARREPITCPRPSSIATPAAARLHAGAGPPRSTGRPPIGLICDAIQMGRMPPTRTIASLILLRPSSRRRPSP